jgi:23S rRNA (uracil1939-C5)-methyltransferase
MVFDPPRQGAQAQVKQLAAGKIPVMIGVSCDVATLARDARTLIDGGYKIASVTPVDRFRQAPRRIGRTPKR